MNDSKNCYILFCQTVKTEKVCQMLNRKPGINAFIPRMEVYIRADGRIDRKVMFPGYLFVRTELGQLEFDALIASLDEERDGIIKELKKSQVSALRDDEKRLLECLLDERGILKMSEGYKDEGRSIVIKGPLQKLQEHIISVDKRDMVAMLDIRFLGRYIKAGLMIRKD